MDRNFNHFQKTYIGVLADVLRDREIGAPADSFDYTATVSEILCNLADHSSYCEPEPQERFEERLCEKIASVLGLEEHDSTLLTAIQDSKGLTRDKNLSEPYRVANDFGEGSEIIRTFIADENRRELMFGVDTGHAEKAYAFFKMRFNEQIDYLYGAEYTDRVRPLSAKQDMKYLGFFSKTDGKVYCLVEPLVGLYDIHDRCHDNSMSAIRENAKNAIRREVADRISMPPASDSEELLTREIQALAKEAEEIYSKNGAVTDFADKVHVSDYLISEDDLVRFICDRDALIKEKTDRILKETEHELKRRWTAHQVLQRILDNIAAGGTVPPVDSIHKPLAFPLWKLDGKPVYVVANSMNNNVCAWKILRKQGVYIHTENAPFDERTYGKDWIAFDHEPPRDVILEWQAAH